MFLPSTRLHHDGKLKLRLTWATLQEFSPWGVYKSMWYLLGRGKLDSTAVVSLFPHTVKSCWMTLGLHDAMLEEAIRLGGPDIFTIGLRAPCCPRCGSGEMKR